MKQALLGAVLALALVEGIRAAAPAHADSRELAGIVDELRQIRRALERGLPRR